VPLACGCANGCYYNRPLGREGKEDDEDNNGGGNALHYVCFPVRFPFGLNITDVMKIASCKEAGYFYNI